MLHKSLCSMAFTVKPGLLMHSNAFKKISVTAKLSVLILLTWFGFAVNAGIHKETFPTQNGTQFLWWPVMPDIDGWSHDREFSLRYGINAQVPDGFSFANSETVIYSKAVYKPIASDLENLDAFIENDKSSLLSKEPTVSIKKLLEFTNQYGAAFHMYSFSPKEKGNWERVAYSEEDEFYLVFTISSRSEQGLKDNLKAYNLFIRNYGEKTEPKPTN